MNNENKKTPWNLLGLVMGFSLFYHLIPRFLVYKWIYAEEVNTFITVDNLVKYGAVLQDGFYPMLEQQIIYVINQVTKIDHVFLCQIFNPLLIALTVIPLYYLARENVSKQKAVIVTVLWSCSEAVFYRGSHFVGTEPLGFLLMYAIFYLYIKKRYIPMLVLLGLIPFAHTLPFVYTIGVLGSHRILTGTRKEQIASVGLIFITIWFIYSPYFSHRRLISVININSIISLFKLSNIHLYSLTDILSGFKIFGGSVVLLAGTVFYIKKNSIERDSFSVLLGLMSGITLVGFIVGWMSYSPHLVAPPRILTYFVVPFSFYFVKLLNKKNMNQMILLVCTIMVLSSMSSMNQMVYLDAAITENEYLAVEELSELGLINNLPDWWSDYTISSALFNKYDRTIKWDIDVDFIEIQETKNFRTEFYTDLLNNAVSLNTTSINSSLEIITKYTYQYIFLSERMKKQAFFLTQNTTGSLRGEHIRIKITDIWHNDPNWTLIYEKNGVLVYKRK